MARIGDGGGERRAVRATTIFGLQTTKNEPEVDLLAIEEEAENRRQMEEKNALASKGSYNGKYGRAKNWNSEYSQRTSLVSLPDRNTRKSDSGRPGMDGTFGPPTDDDYATRATSGSNNVHNSPYGYARKGHSYYDYISDPANSCDGLSECGLFDTGDRYEVRKSENQKIRERALSVDAKTIDLLSSFLCHIFNIW